MNKKLQSMILILIATLSFLTTSLLWFFIEYWIKTGLDFYPGPFLFLAVLKSHVCPAIVAQAAIPLILSK